MKKFIISTILFVVLISWFIPSYGGNRYITSGGHFFATTERVLDRALYYEKRGDMIKLWAMADIGIIRIFPRGIRVKLYTNGTYKLRVHVPRTSRTIWWTTRDALIFPSHRHLAR